MSNIGIKSLPNLPLPGLVDLDISGNALDHLDITALESLSQLRQLDISNNMFTTLPEDCWRFIPYLRSLDISSMPTRLLTKESFQGLHRIQNLVVRDLTNLSRFDADSLTQMTYLSSLHIQSWPKIEKFKFRLGSVISGLASLKFLSARIMCGVDENLLSKHFNNILM